MIGAFLTTLFFSLSAIAAHRSVKALGSARANVWRLVVSLVVLGLFAHLWGRGMGGSGRNWLLLSGVAGMGLGDLAYYAALPRIGSRLSVLITQCLAVPIAATAEWLWLGTRISMAQVFWSAVILGGIVLALMPSRSSPPKVRIRPLGFLMAVGAAFGQGFGAVLSRKASLVMSLSGDSVDGITAAYQRIVGGLAIALAYFILVALLEDKNAAEVRAATPRTWRNYIWVPLNAASGAIIGVSCYQWALFTTPSAIVLPIVACTPIVIVPFSYWLEGERPSRRSLVGGLIAVCGAVALAINR